MEINMKGKSRTISFMALENLLMPMELIIKENFKMMFNMELVSSNLQIVLNKKAIGSMAKCK